MAEAVNNDFQILEGEEFLKLLFWSQCNKYRQYVLSNLICITNIFLIIFVTEQTVGLLKNIKDPPSFLQGFLPRNRFALPATREKMSFKAEIDKKERNYYLFEIIQTKVL